MTRPMPGPPECVCGQCITHKCPEYPHTWSAHCPVHEADAHDAAPKHLTDAECAAELWRERAEWWAGMHTNGPTAEDVDIRRTATWERFATHPHADLEGDPHE